MSDLLNQPTLYPEVNAVLTSLQTKVHTILGDQFVGLYLYGSLSSGDFNLDTSDIDFLVVTTDELPTEIVSQLEVMHHQLMSGGLKWAKKLEGAYLPQAVLRCYDPVDTTLRPCFNEGHFYLARQGSDWIIQRHILREMGVVLAGPPAHTLIDPVPAEDIQWSVRAILREWWRPVLDTPDRLRGDDYQAYAVLTMCRALYALEHGSVVSKPSAARWAIPTLDDRWTPLIEQAVAWRPNQAMDRYENVLEFIRYTLEHSRASESNHD